MKDICSSVWTPMEHHCTMNYSVFEKNQHIWHLVNGHLQKTQFYLLVSRTLHVFGRGQKRCDLRGRKWYVTVGVVTNESEVGAPFATSQKGHFKIVVARTFWKVELSKRYGCTWHELGFHWQAAKKVNFELDGTSKVSLSVQSVFFFLHKMYDVNLLKNN